MTNQYGPPGSGELVQCEVTGRMVPKDEIVEFRGRKVCAAVDYGGGPRPLTETEVELCILRFKQCPDYKARRPLPPIEYW